MKLVYRLEIEVPDDSLAADIGRVLQDTWGWLRWKGWKVRVIGPCEKLPVIRPSITQPPIG
jgi:hypothetical protein